MEENHIFDNHFWQQNMRILTQAAFLLYDKAEYADEALPILKYFTSFGQHVPPASGFNRDGIWHNGTAISLQCEDTCLHACLVLLRGAVRFPAHPWYRNAGRALAYTNPPDSKSTGFGDNSENGDAPTGLRLHLPIIWHARRAMRMPGGMPVNASRWSGRITNCVCTACVPTGLTSLPCPKMLPKWCGTAMPEKCRCIAIWEMPGMTLPCRSVPAPSVREAIPRQARMRLTSCSVGRMSIGVQDITRHLPMRTT